MSVLMSIIYKYSFKLIFCSERKGIYFSFSSAILISTHCSDFSFNTSLHSVAMLSERYRLFQILSCINLFRLNNDEPHQRKFSFYMFTNTLDRLGDLFCIKMVSKIDDQHQYHLFR